MSKRKRELNPKLSVGDKVICLYMDGETSVPPGTLGVVRSVVRDPFEDDGTIYNMSWDNGSELGLVSTSDSWTKLDESQIVESVSATYDFFENNPDLFENFDYKFFRNFLLKLKKPHGIFQRVLFWKKPPPPRGGGNMVPGTEGEKI